MGGKCELTQYVTTHCLNVKEREVSDNRNYNEMDEKGMGVR
jgi:hypothetical protein